MTGTPNLFVDAQCQRPVLRVAAALALALLATSANAGSFCPTTHFIPSANFNVEMVNWLAQPLPRAVTDDEDLLFLYTEADTMERDREPIFQVLVLRDHEHARATLTDAPRSPNQDARPQAVVSARELPASLLAAESHARP